MALDANDHLFVTDLRNNRVQRFDVSGPQVSFELMFGGGVEQGPLDPGDLCTAADFAAGDSCGAGSEGTAPSEFDWTGSPTPWPALGNYIDFGPSGELYVADFGRIQRFDETGTYQGQLALPEPGIPAALAVDQDSGDIYFAYWNSRSVSLIEQPTTYRLDPDSGAVVDTLPTKAPFAIAVGGNGSVYVFDGSYHNGANPGDPENRDRGSSTSTRKATRSKCCSRTSLTVCTVSPPARPAASRAMTFTSASLNIPSGKSASM